MKKILLSICIIALFLGTAIIQVAAEQADANQNKNDIESKPGETMVFMSPYVFMTLAHVDDLEIKGLKIPTSGGPSSVCKYLYATITGIANESNQNSVYSYFREHKWDDGEQIIIKCFYFEGIVGGTSIRLANGFFTRVFE
jgi:hypothetical protein